MQKKKTQLKVLHWLNTGIFPATILFSQGFSYDEINKLLTQKKASEWKTGISNDKTLIDSGKCFALHRTIYRKGDNENGVSLFYLIFRDCMTFTDYEYCKLAHEILHICQFMLPDILNRDREYECEAYLHTHIMQQCLKILRG